MKNKLNGWFKALLALLFVFALSLPAMAGTDVTEITDAATSIFAVVAGVCVTIGVFMIGYKLARKIR